LTLTRGSDNVAQTITLGAIGANGSSALSFSQLGVSINVASDGAGKTAAGLANRPRAGTIVTTAAAGAGSSATLQIGANASDAINVLLRQDGDRHHHHRLQPPWNSALAAFNNRLGDQLGHRADSQALISSVDTAFAQLSASRANLGAVQNRLGHAINNLQVTQREPGRLARAASPTWTSPPRPRA